MRPVLLSLLLLTGCANTISGEVNGMPTPKLADAVYDANTVEIPFLGDFRVVVLMLTDMPEACTVLDQIAEVGGSCADQCEDLVHIQQTWLGDEDYWLTSMAVVVEDEMERTYTQDDDWGENEFQGTWLGLDLRNLDSLDDCLDECEDGDDPVPSDEEAILDGTLVFEEYEQGIQLSGEFELFYEGQEHQEGRFNASACDLQDWFWWL